MSGEGLRPRTCHPSLTLGHQLEYSVLNPNGPFVLLNPIRKLASGETWVLKLSFSPRESVLVSPRPTLSRAAALGLHGPILHSAHLPSAQARRHPARPQEPLVLPGPGLLLEGGGEGQGAPSRLRSRTP